jgi:hypothetical protein
MPGAGYGIAWGDETAAVLPRLRGLSTGRIEPLCQSIGKPANNTVRNREI